MDERKRDKVLIERKRERQRVRQEREIDGVRDRVSERGKGFETPFLSYKNHQIRESGEKVRESETAWACVRSVGRL